MAKSGKQPPKLGDTAASRVTRIGSGFVGAFPGFGPIIQTAISELIPNVRIDRIESYIRYLQERLNELELRIGLERPEGLDTFEEGMWQSARAMSDERRIYIAELVSKGLTSESNEIARARHFLQILNQIDDRQIILLAKFHPRYFAEIVKQSAVDHKRANPDTLGPGISINDIMDHEGEVQADSTLRLNASKLKQLASIGLIEVVGSIGNIGLPSERVAYEINSIGKEFLEFIGAW